MTNDKCLGESNTIGDHALCEQQDEMLVMIINHKMSREFRCILMDTARKLRIQDLYKYKTGCKFFHQKSLTWVGFLIFFQTILK